MQTSTRSVLATTLTLLIVALTLPAPGFAQQTMNAKPLTAEGIALTAAELGPEWSMASHDSTTLSDGSELYVVDYSSPAGRRVHIFAVVASTPDLGEAVLTYLRYRLEDDGYTISSVQSQGFGDGRAFRTDVNNGRLSATGYLFRVRNLITAVSYGGSSSAGDIQTSAIAVARKQEAKLFAVFAPPPVPATLTPVPPAAPTLAPVQAMPTPAPTAAPVPTAAPHCQQAEQPQFHVGFATLSAQLDGRMGNPTSCEFADPQGSGDTLQTTDTGLAIYRRDSNTTTFTTGSDHWALTAAGVVYWSGDSIDPPDTAEADVA